MYHDDDGRLRGSYPGVALLRRSLWDFSRPYRSWVGGAPSLPHGVDWPYQTQGGKRFQSQFLAQICCEDLPEEIWDGHGPRSGWLVFFVDRVLHVAELGESVAPNAPFIDEVLADHSQWRHRRKKGDPQALFRRAPVDLQSFNNRDALYRLLAKQLDTPSFKMQSITERPNLLQCAYDEASQNPEDIETIRHKYALLSSEHFLRWFDHFKQTNIIGFMAGEPAWVQDCIFYYEDSNFDFLKKYLDIEIGRNVPEKIINPYLLFQLLGDEVAGVGGAAYFGVARQDLEDRDFNDVIFTHQDT
ncbi:MAG: DUF1963 domain-containing protein [Pseudomonadota bacterium]